MAHYLPSPEEIRLACEAIRREWSEAERKRRGASHRHHQAPGRSARVRLPAGVAAHIESNNRNGRTSMFISGALPADE